MQTTVVAIVGPTASGKTALGVFLASKRNGEIVSADSMQVYRGMRIATAQPTFDEMNGIPHHLIDFVPITEAYSVARYVHDANRIIDDIAARNKTPFLVGGTGLYVSSLIDGINFPKDANDPVLRAHLKREAELEGNLEMHRRLFEIDPEYARSLHPNNLGRVLRALELYACTGVTMTRQIEHSKNEPARYRAVMIGLTFSEREMLYHRIDRRVEEMQKNNLVKEAEEFFAENGAKTAAQAIGHKELKPFLNKQKSLEFCVECLKRETRRYAKRQLTWFRRDPRITWFEADKYENAQQLHDAVLYHVDKALQTGQNKTQ
jgi:tRNA dimethylallyltransferase